MICAKWVFSCFKTLERWGDKVTGAAGPFFVALALILLSLGTLCFYDVIAPDLSYPIISTPVCLLITLNMYMHYFYAITVPPGFIDDPPRDPVDSLLWARKVKDKGKQRMTSGVRWSAAGPKITPGSTTKCRKCRKFRPERTHHCRICDKCVLKFDHHCPWINQCVGLHNERHFVLFMAYLVIATFTLSLLGYQHFLDCLGISYQKWEHNVPEFMFAMIYILSVVLCFAVSVLLIYQLYGITYGETSVEAQDHEVYRRQAKRRNEEFVNSYDCGKWKNLQLFFNIGDRGYSKLTLFLPFRLNPYTDGFSWARKDGYENHHGVRIGEELTDEDDDDA